VFWKKIWIATKREWHQTIQMVHTYYRFLRYKKHLCIIAKREAKLQLYDIPKFLPFFLAIVFPCPGIVELYLGLAFLISKWSKGKVAVLPSEFNKIFNEGTT